MELNREKFEIIGYEGQDSEAILRPNMTFFQDAWRRLKKNKVAMFSLVLLVILAVLTIIGPYITKYSYTTQNLDKTNLPPDSTFWFGTDELGRDIFSRLWIGGRVSLAIGIIATAIEIVIGSMYGGISGYLGGLADDIMMRIVEILNTIPDMIIIILMSIVLGAGFTSLILAISLLAWVGIARLIRGMVLQLKESEYVLAAQALGADTSRIIVKHLIPNTIGLLIIYISLSIPGFIFYEAFLSFIGLGVQPPQTSWGAMITQGQQMLDFYPHQFWAPAITLSLTMLAFNLLGDGLRDALDPKLRA